MIPAPEYQRMECAVEVLQGLGAAPTPGRVCRLALAMWLAQQFDGIVVTLTDDLEAIRAWVAGVVASDGEETQ